GRTVFDRPSRPGASRASRPLRAGRLLRDDNGRGQAFAGAGSGPDHVAGSRSRSPLGLAGDRRSPVAPDLSRRRRDPHVPGGTFGGRTGPEPTRTNLLLTGS